MDSLSFELAFLQKKKKKLDRLSKIFLLDKGIKKNCTHPTYTHSLTKSCKSLKKCSNDFNVINIDDNFD